MQPTESGQFHWKFETEANAGTFKAVRCGPGTCELLWHDFDLDAAAAARSQEKAIVALFAWGAVCLFFMWYMETQWPIAPPEQLACGGRHWLPAGPKSR